jgi:hypothetical protein
MTTSRPAPAHRQLANLGPVEQLRAGRLPRRLVQLVVGLAFYGASMAMVIRGALGAIPWDVLHTGLIQHIPVSFGQMSIIVALAVLLAWIPLRQKPGLGTIANALLVGIAADITLAASCRRSTTSPPAWRCCSAASCSTAWPPRCTSAPSSAPARATAS